MEIILWNLFKKTGDVKYYLLYNKLKGNDVNERKGSRNNIK